MARRLRELSMKMEMLLRNVRVQNNHVYLSMLIQTCLFGIVTKMISILNPLFTDIDDSGRKVKRKKDKYGNLVEECMFCLEFITCVEFSNLFLGCF